MVKAPPAARRSSTQEILLALASAALGALLLWFSLAGLIPFVRGVGARAPLVTFSAMDARALAAALAAFSFAIMFAAPSDRSNRTAARKASPDRTMMRWVGTWLTLAVVFALLALIAGPIAQVVVAPTLEHQGYRLCPAAKVWEHHPPMRWVRGSGQCP